MPESVFPVLVRPAPTGNELHRTWRLSATPFDIGCLHRRTCPHRRTCCPARCRLVDFCCHKPSGQLDKRPRRSNESCLKSELTYGNDPRIPRTGFKDAKGDYKAQRAASTRAAALRIESDNGSAFSPARSGQSNTLGIAKRTVLMIDLVEKGFYPFLRRSGCAQPGHEEC